MMMMCTLEKRSHSMLLYSMLGALGSVVISVEAFCQWALLSVQIIRHFPTIYIFCTEVHLSFCTVSKVHAGSFRASVIHRTLIKTTGTLTYVRDHYYACVYTHGGWAHRQRVNTTFLTIGKTHIFFLCSCRGSNSGHRYNRISSPTLYQLSHPVNPNVCKYKCPVLLLLLAYHHYYFFGMRWNPDVQGATGVYAH